MQVPLLHRSTQMVLLKKQIRRKAKELRLRKRNAHRRLQLMRRIRDHLLHRMRNSIDHRQRDAEQKKREQTRRAVGGMLSMYKHWLLSWSKALRLQSQLIRHQEHVKLGLRRKLRHLRRQLKKVRNPQNLVDKCFNRLFKAVRKWQKRSDYYEHVKDQDKIWEAEAQEVRNYLSEVRGRRPRKLRRGRAKKDIEIENFAKFWKTEVLHTRALINKQMAMAGRKQGDLQIDTSHHKTRKSKKKGKERYFSLDELVIRKKFKRIRKGIRKPKKQDPLKPSLEELKMLIRELISFNWKKKVIKIPKIKRKTNKNPKFDFGKIPSISDVSNIIQKVRIKKKLKSGRGSRSVPDPKIIKSKVTKPKLRKRKMHYVDRVIKDELNALLETKAKKRDYNRGKTNEAETLQQRREKKEWEKQENILETLYNDIPLYMRRDIERRNRKKLRDKLQASSSSSSIASQEIFIGSEKVPTKSDKYKKLSSTSSGFGNKDRPALSAERSGSHLLVKRDSVASLSESLNKLVMAGNRNRKFTRKSIRLPLIVPKKIRVAPPKGQEESHYQSLKKDIMYLHSNSHHMGVSRITASESALHRGNQSNRYPPRRASDTQLGIYPKSQSQVFGHLFSKSPSSNKFIYDPLPDDLQKLLAPVRDRQDKTENAPKTNVKDFDSKRFHLKDLRSDAKFKHVQFLLKDVIQRNEVIDYIADVNGLMQEVANHEMWSKLQSLYNELKESGVPLTQIKESLAKKYLEYLNEIVIERNYARIEPPRDKRLNVLETESVNAKQKKEVEKFMERNWWSRKRMSTRIIPFGMRGLRTSKSDPPHSSRLSQEIKMDGGLYNKLLEQELNAEQLEREERRRRRFSSTFGSAISFNNSLDLSNEEQEMRDFEWRYSLHNIRSMMNQHQLMFQALDRKSRVEQVVHKKIKGEIEELYTSAQFKRPKKHSTPFTARKRSKNLRPVEELYYSPRKTCRLQKISCSAECLACVGQVEKIGDSMVLDKCPRCGVKVPVPAPTTSFSMSSSSSCEILSSGSIEACAKNKLLINTLEDLCTRCGYVHKKEHLCSRLPMNERKTKLLKRIKDSVPTAPECPSFCCPRGILKNTRSFDP
ncbi:uncharacterized protein LOC6608988 [Drosophila sechellia]|uniref:uncharacterized protein LOC6608988 n=1 Tax=Drosophila sechellia TaxID=7238 RepID=UPI0013DDAB24|nr:uncharacterized protein LOC6608988 [Drosophila sechellia]